MIFSSVVLPQPLGPMMLKNSFARIERFTSARAFTSVVLLLDGLVKTFRDPLDLYHASSLRWESQIPYSEFHIADSRRVSLTTISL